MFEKTGGDGCLAVLEKFILSLNKKDEDIDFDSIEDMQNWFIEVYSTQRKEILHKTRQAT